MTDGQSEAAAYIETTKRQLARHERDELDRKALMRMMRQRETDRRTIERLEDAVQHLHKRLEKLEGSTGGYTGGSFQV